VRRAAASRSRPYSSHGDADRCVGPDFPPPHPPQQRDQQARYAIHRHNGSGRLGAAEERPADFQEAINYQKNKQQCDDARGPG
jgi:hypothetical protein